MKKRMTLLITTLLTTTMLLSVVPVVNAADTNEVETQPTTVVEPVVKPTTINLKEKSKTLYLKGTYTIKPNVVNAVGDTVFVSNDNSVATVDNNGVVTAKKKGSTVITITNNNVVAQFKVVVKKPTVNLKKGKAKKVPVGTSFKLKITGKVGKTTYKVSNKKFKVNKNGKLKAKKPGKATITIKTNGITIKRKIKSTLKLKITYKFKKKVKINVGQSKKIKKLYKYTTNLKTLKKYVSTKKYKKYKKQVDKKAKSPKAKIKNTKVAKVVDNKVISGKKKGSTEAVVSCGKQNFDVLTETTFKGEKAKVAYSADEFYKLYQDQVMKYIIKGEDPKDYKYILCNFKKMSSPDSVREIIVDCLEKYYDNPNYFYDFEGAGYDVFQQNGKSAYGKYYKTAKGPFYIKIEAINKTENKKLYNAAQDILNSINIDSFEEDYEKMIALWIWYEKNCGYGKCPYSGSLNSEKGLIYDSHIGVCTDYALATNYFCALMGIPSIRTDNMSDHNHEWNLVRIQNKWYHYDANNSGVWFIGDDYLGDIFLMNKFYTDLGWQKKVSDTSFTLYKSKIIEISEKCGITEFEVIKVNLTTGEKTKSTAPVWRSFDGSHNFIKDT